VNQQILFIQGGGAGTHDEWDDKLSVGHSVSTGWPSLLNERSWRR
jgi:hypothetical protein